MATRTTEQLTAAVPLLAGLGEQTVALLAGCACPASAAAGELIAREGAPADRFYAVTAGRVGLEIHAAARGGLLIETIGAGQVVGWSWLVPPYRWQFDVRALEPVQALAFDALCLRRELERDPALGYQLLRRFTPVMLARLQATRLRLLDVYGNPAG